MCYIMFKSSDVYFRYLHRELYRLRDFAPLTADEQDAKSRAALHCDSSDVVVERVRVDCGQNAMGNYIRKDRPHKKLSTVNYDFSLLSGL